MDKRSIIFVKQSFKNFYTSLYKHFLTVTIIGITVFMLVSWAVYSHRSGLVLADWTGFISYYDSDGNFQRGKTL